MITRLKSDKIIINDSLFDGYVYIENGIILSVFSKELPADICYDYTGKYISPGFIDIHTHGGGGYAFADTNATDVIKACDFHLTHGTTSIVPTVSASEYSAMKRSLENIVRAKNSGRSKANILGAHLEGPYLSPAQCGAQCTSYLHPPVREEYEMLVREYSDSILRWTYAPEYDTGGKFCKFITSHKINASAGHTNAKYSDMKTALKNGCNCVTHLYSCTSTVTRDRGFRSLGVIETAFLENNLFTEIIADGKHLPPELIKMIIKIKGFDKVILVTDSLEAAGADISGGHMCGTDFIVEDGVAKLPDRSAFVGSIATADALIRVLTHECGIDIPRSVKMMSETPAKLLGLNKGKLEAQTDADIIVFDDNINITDVFVDGKRII